MTQLANDRQPQAAENREWVHAKIEERGWDAELRAMAWEVFTQGLREAGALVPYDTWDARWARAYEDGHNNRGLRGKRLAHYAHAYADACEEANQCLSLLFFYFCWQHGDVYEGTAGEHWHVA